MQVRHETTADHAAIRAVLLAAFETTLEADIVEALRVDGRLMASLVAEQDSRIVGHVALSPVELEGGDGSDMAGIAPLCVHPHDQGRGIGSALMRAVIERGRALSCGAFVLLGDETFYRRFGFTAGSDFGVSCVWTTGPAFQVLELRPGAFEGVHGVVRYDESFDAS